MRRLCRLVPRLLVLAFGTLANASLAFATAPAGGAADTGFRPKPHGFSFPNWGKGENPQGALTAEDARCLFGDTVCARVVQGKCEPTPAARLWIAEMNRSMGNGHCEGLAALSAALYTGARRPEDFGGKTAWELPPKDARVLRLISTLFTTQGIEPVQSVTAKTRQMSTRQIVDTLARSFQDKKETYTLGIYSSQGGHAITPFAVDDVGGGRYKIHVYDNNYPGADNVVEVDTGRDTWRYAGAALNPGEPAAPWEGTGGSMDLTAQSVRFAPLVCPFCEKQSPRPMCGTTGPASQPQPPRAPSAQPRTPAAPSTQPRPPSTPSTQPRPPKRPSSQPSTQPRTPTTPSTQPRTPATPSTRPRRPAAPGLGPTSLVTEANCDQVVVKDKKSGNRLSFDRGRMVSQIPNALMTRQRGGSGCTLQLPAGGDYEVSIAGLPGQAPQPIDTAIFRPGQAVSIDGASVAAGQVDSMGVGDSSFSYRPAAGSRPSLILATDEEDGEDGYYEITNLALGAGDTFSIEEGDDGRVAFDSDNHDVHFDVDVTLEDEDGVHDYSFDNVMLNDDSGEILDLPVDTSDDDDEGSVIADDADQHDEQLGEAVADDDDEMADADEEEQVEAADHEGSLEDEAATDAADEADAANDAEAMDDAEATDDASATEVDDDGQLDDDEEEPVAEADEDDSVEDDAADEAGDEGMVEDDAADDESDEGSVEDDDADDEGDEGVAEEDDDADDDGAADDEEEGDPNLQR
jgi:hypothetical protein